MIDHFGINCADFEKSKEFYDSVLGVLGFTRQMDYQVAIGYGRDGKPDFWIADISAGDASGPNREVHVAFQAADTDAVQAFYDAAVGLGAEALHAPRLWPEYHEGYYAGLSATPTATTSRPSATRSPPARRDAGRCSTRGASGPVRVVLR